MRRTGFNPVVHVTWSSAIAASAQPWEKANVIASKVMFYLHLDNVIEARISFEAALRQGYSMSSDLSLVQRMLDENETGLRGETHLSPDESWKLWPGQEKAT